MSRLSPINQAAAVSAFVPFAYFAELDFGGGFVRVWTGVGTITTLSTRTFLGFGDLTGIGRIEETAEISPRNLPLVLSGVPRSMVATVHGETYRGRKAKVWKGYLNDGFTVLLDTPDLIFSGRMDTCTIEYSDTTASITVNCESRLVDLRRPRVRRLSHDAQVQTYPGDLGISFISRLSERPIYFGSRGPAGVPGYS